jgi:hypothetical protein
MTEDWLNDFENEINLAQNARQLKNEGKSRVCARRAAGIVAKVFLSRKGYSLNSKSAFEYLKLLRDDPDISSETRQVVEHFLTRVTPAHKLPFEADLIGEARWLARNLLGLSDDV